MKTRPTTVLYGESDAFLRPKAAHSKRVPELNNFNKSAKSRAILFLFATSAAVGLALPRADADTVFQQIGLTQLQTISPNINGAGVSVGQVEASISSTNVNLFEPNSSNAPNTQFTYFDGSGTSSGAYNPADGSWHANYVASFFYGANGAGVSPGVSHVYVFQEGDYYFDIYEAYAPATYMKAGIAKIINQSFVYSNETASQIGPLDATWDNYAAEFGTLYVSAVGDGGTGFQTGTTPVSYVNPPSDSYNGIAVAAYGGATGFGPTYDGRSKPDITAPGAYSSYTAPIISGAAALLVQAGEGTNLSGPVGLGASDTSVVAAGALTYSSNSTDPRTLKALLLNGASKPQGWTNSYSISGTNYTYNSATAYATTPLDPRYGSGIVNIYSSYENLNGGEHHFSGATTTPLGVVVSAVPNLPTVSAFDGWDFNSITASTTADGENHYVFSLPGSSNNSWDVTATLDWNKDFGAIGINHLMLYLLNSNGAAIASSTSMIDNVQQISLGGNTGLNALAPGKYDLVVQMLGGSDAIISGGSLQASEQYALAWNFTDPAQTPEPGSLVILAFGLLAIVSAGRTRGRRLSP